jgi:uncharacterized Ntn-hydrolase superfamily protein
MKQALLILSISVLTYVASAQHTFSIVAVDAATGEIGSAGATCGDTITWPGTPGAKLISHVEPGKFAVHSQAYHITPNHQNAIAQMLANKSPQQAIDWLVANDNQGNPNIRQYGIVDYNGGSPRSAAHTGMFCDDYKNHILGPNYAIQGNILLGPQILDSMKSKFEKTNGSLTLKLMAALQGANVVGADMRCTTNNTSSKSAFIRVARPTDNVNNLWLDINVGATNAGIEPIGVLQQKLNLFLNINEQGRKTPYKFAIYPNPVKDIARLEFMNSALLPDEITLFDVMGKQLMHFSGSEISATMKIDLSGYGAGIYFIRLNKSGSLARTDRICKQ